MKEKINKAELNRIDSNYFLKSNREKIAKTFDLAITCSGFEMRTLGLFKNLDTKTVINKLVVFLYHPNEENLYIKNLQSLGDLKKLFNNLTIKEYEIIHIDPTNPWGFKETLSDILSKNKIITKSQVLVDITSFTRVFLYEIVYALYASQSAFTIAYTEPNDYVEVLPSGINKIIISPSFSGESRPNKKSFLLLFFGWESNRTREVFDAYNSDDQLGVLGISPIDKKHILWHKKSRERNKDLIEEIKSLELCSTLNLEQIIHFIYEIHNKKESEYKKNKQNFSFAIAGMGTKIQNLAACLVAINKKDIQLVYGAPAYWGSSDVIPVEKPVESTGIGNVFIYGPFSKKIIKKYPH